MLPASITVMRVTQNIISDSFISNIQSITAKQLKIYNQISSGQRVSVSSDDPTAVNRVMGMQVDQRQLEQFQKNIARANEASTVTYSNVKNLKDFIVSAGEVAIKADGITGPSEYQTYVTQLNSLIEQAIQTGNAQQRGQYLFSGNSTTTAPFVPTRDTNGEVTAVAYAGSTSTSSIDVAQGVSISPYSSPTQNQEIQAAITHMIALRDALKLQDPAAVATAGASLTADEGKIIDQMSAHASIQARLEMIGSQIDISAQSITQRISADAEVDIAQATVAYNTLDTAYKAAVAAGGRMLTTSLLDYI